MVEFGRYEAPRTMPVDRLASYEHLCENLGYSVKQIHRQSDLADAGA